MTGMASLNLSAICWASLKLRGTTRCTLDARARRRRRVGAAGQGPGSGRRGDRLGAARGHDGLAVRRCRRCRSSPRTPALSPRQPAHVRAVAVGPLELLVRRVPVLVPVLVLLGDAEVDERAVPEVGKAHCASEMVTRRPERSPLRAPRARSRRARRSRPPRRRRGSPGSCPSRAPAARAPRRARAAAGSTGARPPGRLRAAASSSARARRGRARETPAARPARPRTSSPRPRD